MDRKTRVIPKADMENTMILAELSIKHEHLKEQVDRIEGHVTDITDGKFLPQCQNHEARILATERKLDAQEAWNKKLFMSGIGAGIALLAKYVFEKVVAS